MTSGPQNYPTASVCRGRGPFAEVLGSSESRSRQSGFEDGPPRSSLRSTMKHYLNNDRLFSPSTAKTSNFCPTSGVVMQCQSLQPATPMAPGMAIFSNQVIRILIKTHSCGCSLGFSEGRRNIRLCTTHKTQCSGIVATQPEFVQV